MNKKVILLLVFVCALVLNLSYFNIDSKSQNVSQSSKCEIQSKEEIIKYIQDNAKLPDNYISKNDAIKLGWDAKSGNLWDVAPCKSIGGDRFGNYEKILPQKSGRRYIEADVEYRGGKRNAKRIVYSNDGLIFYTKDHYKSFERVDKNR